MLLQSRFHIPIHADWVCVRERERASETEDRSSELTRPLTIVRRACMHLSIFPVRDQMSLINTTYISSPVVCVWPRAGFQFYSSPFASVPRYSILCVYTFVQRQRKLCQNIHRACSQLSKFHFIKVGSFGLFGVCNSFVHFIQFESRVLLGRLDSFTRGGCGYLLTWFSVGLNADGAVKNNKQ